MFLQISTDRPPYACMACDCVGPLCFHTLAGIIQVDQCAFIYTGARERGWCSVVTFTIPLHPVLRMMTSGGREGGLVMVLFLPPDFRNPGHPPAPQRDYLREVHLEHD